MTTVGYFCSAGYTEAGGMQAFLEKINPHIRWERCFPAILKPAPKKGRIYPAPVPQESGVSGKHLLERMFEKLANEKFERDKYSYILVIDDMDCRFDGGNKDVISSYLADISYRVNQLIGREVTFDVLFASPEVESWFVADWSNSFAQEYPKELSHSLRMSLRMALGEYWDCIEDCGGPLVNGSCSYKLSEDIGKMLYELQSGGQLGRAYSYSKRVQGAAMLKRIHPHAVAGKCRLYFSPVFTRLRGWE